MGSIDVLTSKRKPMWISPKTSGLNPSERWGHSACCYNGMIYVFGGCCEGLHFSDVITLDLNTMIWSSFATRGQGPRTRDSHSSVIIDEKMIIFGGTDGSRKVNDLHILNLRSREWSQPHCEGIPPSPRESHTSTIVDNDKLVIFGGSGEGEGNNLSDVHILNLKTMNWTSPKVKGVLPAARDSHIAISIGNKLLVHGGDGGDRYHGEVDVLDMESLTWSRLEIQGSSPGVRAGHAAVNIGNKVYVIGGVGDKHYYNDVWSFDINTCSWTQLGILGPQPQGRFSHSAVVFDSDIIIYGGCGEDERPLNELLMLQLGTQHPLRHRNLSLGKVFGYNLNLETRNSDYHVEYTTRDSKTRRNVTAINEESNLKESERGSNMEGSPFHNSDNIPEKRRKPCEIKLWEVSSEQEEHSHSHSLSQHSSPSQSDQEQTPIQRLSSSSPNHSVFPQPSNLFNQNPKTQNYAESNDLVQRSLHGFPFLIGEPQRQHQPEPFVHVPKRSSIPNMIGAEVRGTIDGSFDSGYLMTANLNGQTLRGVLFPPGPGFVARTSLLPCHSSLTNSSSHANVNRTYQDQAINGFVTPASCNRFRPRGQHRHIGIDKSSSNKLTAAKHEVHGVILTLGGPRNV